MNSAADDCLQNKNSFLCSFGIGNICEGDPCGSHGQCREDGSEFTCSCESTYTGKFCETRKVYFSFACHFHNVSCNASFLDFF